MTRGPPWLGELLPFKDRDGTGRLIQVDGQPLLQHLDRLSRVRSFLLEQVRPMAAGEFHRIRRRPRYDVSPDWVLHHLLQHEAEHRAHIAWLRDSHPAA